MKKFLSKLLYVLGKLIPVDKDFLNYYKYGKTKSGVDLLVQSSSIFQMSMNIWPSLHHHQTIFIAYLTEI